MPRRGCHQRYQSINLAPQTALAVLSAAVDSVPTPKETVQRKSSGDGMGAPVAIIQTAAQPPTKLAISDLHGEVASLSSAIESTREELQTLRGLVREKGLQLEKETRRAQAAERSSEIHLAEAAFWERASRRANMKARRLETRLEHGEGSCRCQEIMIFEGICRVVESFWITFTGAGRTY